MKDVEYVYAVSYIKTLENKMLTNSDLQTLISSENSETAKRFLREHGWVGDSADELLKNELKNAWSAVYDVCLRDTPIDILLYENDFHNLKTVLKSYIAKTDWSSMVLSPSITNPEIIETAIKTKDMSSLPEYLKNVTEEAYQILTSTMDGQLTEIYIDKAEHLAVIERAKKEKNEFLTGWAELLITLSDLKTAWRTSVEGKSEEFIKNALIRDREELLGNLQSVKDYIKSNFPDADITSIGAFEKWCDNKKLAYAKTAKAESFGFAPIVAFLIGKKSEVQSVRIILACIENGWDDEIIRERLRDAYV